MTLRNVRSSVGRTLYKQVGRASSLVQGTRTPPVDVLETEDAYRVVFDAPGSESEDVQVRYVDGAVRIRIDRYREYYEGYEMRYPGRSMELDGEATLPADAAVDPDRATARVTDAGTLEVDVPKADASESTTADADEISIDD